MSIKVQRLNMDNSWWVEIDGLSFLVDPWLEGSEVDYFSWFNTQWHRTKPIEYDLVPDYDFVVITQKYPDHFHKKTLAHLNPANVLVPKSILKAVKKLLPDSTVMCFEESMSNLFETGLNMHHIPTSRKIDPIYDSFVFENGKESVFISTHGHGLTEEQKRRVLVLPRISILFTPFNHYQLPAFLGGTVSPGLEGVEHLVDVLNPKRIVATHDEDKHAKGLVSKFAKVVKSPDTKTLQELKYLKDRYVEISSYELQSIT